MRLGYGRCQAQEVVWIAGNHDTWIWKWGIGRRLSQLNHVHYLQDSAIEVGGLKVYGTPWTAGAGITHSWWAFDLLTIPGRVDPFAAIPGDADIVLTHSPPYGIGDMVLRGKQVGSPELLERLLTVEPRLVVHGHIHEEYGVRRLSSTSRAPVVNAALLDERYRALPERDPVLIDL